MKNQTSIDFTSKFHLLNSQENCDSEEIIWSCSDSSDYETKHKENNLNINNKISNRKRKRANKKLVNTSNLDINFTDSQEKKNGSKTSPHLEKYNISKSPILCQKSVKSNITLSPIILLKHASSSSVLKSKKKLFETNLHRPGKSKSDGCTNYCAQINNDANIESLGIFTNIIERSNNLTEYCNAEKKNIKDGTKQELIEKGKSYFDSHFSSQSTQHSISEYETESSRSNDIEITSSLTPTALSIKLEPKSSSDSLRSFDQETDTKSKKVKYKKNGLSYRLNSLLKKQNASFSLWHHERFLAVNSNFVIPREEFIAFQIKNVHSKYASFLLDAMGSDGKKFLILINNLYINNNVMEQNAIFKLYKPFREIDFDIHYKLIVNVCKFECTGFIS